MRLHGACLVALLLVASSVDAQSLKRAPSKGGTVGDLVRQFRKADGNERKKVVNVDTINSNYIFAAAGSVQGSGGTFFRSDVTIYNHRSSQQDIAVAWLAQGVDNTQAPLDYFSLDPDRPIIARDFVFNELGKTGLGAVIIAGVLSNGDLDTNAQLDGFSRIWTPQPGQAGTVAQAFPSVAFQDSLGSGVAYAQGLRHDAGFRTNAGIVNLDDIPHTWTVDVNSLGGRTSFPITVPPLSMRQMVIPQGNWSDLILGFQTTATGFWWSAYGATVDNASGDSWSSHASQP